MAAPHKAGELLGQYRLVEQIGAGGMGVVFRARDERLERDVAIKFLPAGPLGDDAARKRFHKEAVLLSKLNHPNIAGVYEFETHTGFDFLVMEYVSGQTLAERLARGPLAETDVYLIGAQITAALEEAHSRGIVHRDLKPANVMVTPEGQVKVLDFGLAKLRPETGGIREETLTEVGKVAGTLPYMSPEQVRGEAVDARCDLWAVGVLLYEMASGSRPFPQTHGPLLTDAILHRPPPVPSTLNPRMSPAFDRLVLKALAKAPQERHVSARQLRSELQDLSAARPVLGRRPALLRLPPLRLAAIAVAVTAVASVVFYAPRLLWPPPPVRSLAVMPFISTNQSVEAEYLVDGITENIISQLAAQPELKVIARGSVFRYKERQPPLSEIGRQLGVEALLRGTVQVTENVVIRVELVNVRDGRLLWSNRYSQELNRLESAVEDIARDTAGRLRLELATQPRAASTRTPEHGDAYRLYLKGRFQWNKRSPEGLRASVELFEQAIETEPTFALAYVGLADAYAMLGNYGVIDPSIAYPRARSAATRALELDEDLAEAHAALASIRDAYDWDWAGAERAYLRAIELKPGYATAHQWYALYLTAQARLPEAIAEIRRAQQLDPLSPIISNTAGWVLFFARQYERAIEQFRTTLETEPNFLPSRWRLAEALKHKKDYAAAIREFEVALALSRADTHALALLGHTYALSGRRSDALKILEELTETAKTRYVSPYSFAILYLGLGQQSKAVDWLEQGYRSRSDWMPFCAVDPNLQALRSDPRFLDLLRRIGLPH